MYQNIGIIVITFCSHFSTDDVYIGYLPLAHVLELSAGK